MSETEPLLPTDQRRGESPLEKPSRTIQENTLLMAGGLLFVFYVFSQLFLVYIQDVVNHADFFMNEFNVTSLTARGFNVQVKMQDNLPLTPSTVTLTLVQPYTTEEKRWFPFGVLKWPDMPMSVQLADLRVKSSWFSKEFTAEIVPGYFFIPKSDFGLRLQSQTFLFGFFSFPSWNYFQQNGNFND